MSSADKWAQYEITDAPAKVDKWAQYEVAKPENMLDKVKRYGLKDPVAGTLKVGRGLMGFGPWLANMGLEAAGSDKRLEAQFQPSDEDIYKMVGLPPASEQGAGDMISQLIPDLAGAVLAPEVQMGRIAALLGKAPGVAGKVLPKVAQTATTQGLYAGAISPDESRAENAAMASLLSGPFSAAGQYARTTPSVIGRNIAAGGTGLAAGGLGYYGGQAMGAPDWASGLLGAAMGGAGYRGLASPDKAKAAQLKGVNLSDPNTQARLEAAERLGVPITPAEASKDPFLGTRHADLSRSQEGSKAGYDAGKKKIEKEASSIERLKDTIFEPESMGKQVSEGYERVRNIPIPEDVALKYSENPVVQQVIKKIERNPISMFSADKKGLVTQKDGKQILDQSKLGTWDEVKRYIDRQHESATKPDAKPGDKFIAEDLDKTRKSIISDLDNISPDYAETRALAERKIARKTIDKAFNKSEIDTGHALYNAVLKDKTKFNDLMHNLRNVPEAQQMLKDMKLIFDEARTVPTVRGAAGRQVTGMLDFRSLIKEAEAKINNMFSGGKLDEEAIEFIYSGEWSKRMDEINKITNTSKRTAAFMDLLGDLAPAAQRKVTEKEQ